MEGERQAKRRRVNDHPKIESRHSDRSHHIDFGDDRRGRGAKTRTIAEQTRLNKIQEDERHREFLAKENHFLIQQKRKAAEIRVREHRARPVDVLSANLRLIDPIQDLINDDIEASELEYVHPESLIQSQTASQLQLLLKEIDEYLEIEYKSNSRDYWKTVKIICQEQQKDYLGKAVRSVSGEIDMLLRPKTYNELTKLEGQISRKLNSNELIDTDYWQQLLESLLLYKAKAKLQQLYHAVLESRKQKSRKENARVAALERDKVHKLVVSGSQDVRQVFEPLPLRNLDSLAGSNRIIDEKAFLQQISSARAKMSKTGFGAVSFGTGEEMDNEKRSSQSKTASAILSSSFDSEVVRDIEEDEEVFAGEEQVETRNADEWKARYKPRKPRYFNRVQMGYEWNKYNQTHYDHDNPPPKVVQGYKFHIFYPDLVDPSKAPTYRIIREDGRKKGETIAPAGEEDTCIIRFMSGPPYEDVAFRIVDRDWDYSARYDRGFKSIFEDGILTLHFSFKKVYYRK